MEANRSRGAAAFIGEMGFVLAALLLLKEWVFPWLIWQWFPTGDDAARMLEWMMIMVAVVTCLAYAGFGSVSAHIYATSRKDAITVWAFLHLPFMVPSFSSLPTVPLLADLSHAWNGLIGDGLRLFVLELPMETQMVPLVAFFFFCVGRRIYVSDEPEEKQEQRQGRSVI